MVERRLRDVIVPIPIRNELHHDHLSKKQRNKQASYPRRLIASSGERQQIEEYGQAARAISTASLNPSLVLTLAAYQAGSLPAPFRGLAT